MKKHKPNINFELCKGCGRCVPACPKGILKMGKKLNHLGFRHVEHLEEGCIGCGACFYCCPEPEAIIIVELRSEND